MRILHILDHSIPLHSGYTFRTLAILKEQRELGWETFHLTGSKQENCVALEEDFDGWHFYRTPVAQGLISKLPVLNQIAVIDGLTRRLDEVVKIVKPDILHAHSPVLNALPALRVGRRLGIPVVYEIRAFWEDAAVDHGTSHEWATFPLAVTLPLLIANPSEPLNVTLNVPSAVACFVVSAGAI